MPSKRALISAAAVVLVPAALAQQPAPRTQQPAPRTSIDHAIEAYISEDALQALYVRAMNSDELGPIDVRAGVFFNEQRDLIGIADALAEVGDPQPTQRLVFKVGPRMFGAFLNEEDEDIFGVGVGGEARYYFNRSRTTSVALNAYYAPDILTFGAADNVQDVSVRLETELRDGTDVYIGYREFEIDVRGGDREVDDNIHVGFRRRF
jgi:hypothetical protein